MSTYGVDFSEARQLIYASRDHGFATARLELFRDALPCLRNMTGTVFTIMSPHGSIGHDVKWFLTSSGHVPAHIKVQVVNFDWQVSITEYVDILEAADSYFSLLATDITHMIITFLNK